MCGIAGLFRRRGRDGADPERLRAMTDRIRHRGPDDHGYLLMDSRDGRFDLGRSAVAAGPCDVHLGNRRLSIFDPSVTGWQPMTNERRTVFLTFNGAVYNHVELRRELEGLGHHFVSSSDTEVIVHAYEQWGESCVQRFNGMWAFALWDQERRRLFCSRDRFGVKPFYAFLSEDVFIFASEIKAILPAMGGRAAPDLAVVHDFLGLRIQSHSPETFFAGIRQLPAAHNWVVTDDEASQTRYWDYSTQSHGYDFDHPEETFHELLRDAVRLRLRSDVPVGIALSGGLDSTAISAFARRHQDGPIQAFTVEFPGSPHDERRYAELVADRLGLDLHCVRYPVPALIEDLRQVVWHLDFPSLRPSVVARWRLMETAAREVKVVLEGQGSDELLGGYLLKYFATYARDELEHPTPRVVAKLARTALDLVRRRRLFLPRGWAASRARRNGLHPDLQAVAPGGRAIEPSALAGGPFHDRLTRRLHAEHSRDFLPQLLHFGDAIGMGRSLEVRMPFMDYRLVEFAFQLPYGWKIDGSESKVLLRRSCRSEIPPEILARRVKVGFNTPMHEWLRAHVDTSVRPMLLDDRARGRNLLDAAYVERTLRRLAAGDDAVGELVFHWLSLEIWFQLFIDGAGFNGIREPT